MSRVLIIEDDADIALSLKYSLERQLGFVADVAHDGESGLELARNRRPDLLLLDLNLPGISGLDVCRALREDPGLKTLPIIMLTARVDEADRVAGLELGADDYVTKPFSVKEVLARVKAVLRRAGREEPHELVASGPLVLDRASRRVTVDSAEVSLTRKEFDLLLTLMRHPDRVLTREWLLERVWGYERPGETRTVDVHVRQLRKKLGPEVATLIETVVGVGYRLRRKA